MQDYPLKSFKQRDSTKGRKHIKKHQSKPTPLRKNTIDEKSAKYELGTFFF